MLYLFQVLLDNCQMLKLSDFTLARSIEDADKEVPYDLKRAAQVAFGECSSEDRTERERGGIDRVPGVLPLDAVPSPFYAAPELFEGGKFGKASDLWSLGVLTYELCTGELLASTTLNDPIYYLY